MRTIHMIICEMENSAAICIDRPPAANIHSGQPVKNLRNKYTWSIVK